MAEHEPGPPKTNEDPKATVPYVPGWEAVEVYLASQICLMHQAKGEPHDDRLHQAHLLSLLTGMLVGIALQRDHSFEADVLLAETLTLTQRAGLTDHDHTASQAADFLAEIIRDAHDRTG